ncbi:MAG: HAD family hydrolase [Ruminococcaceae bacterium]|nr:HAD family hydrolase [Oscillospiraceae bacterium]
MSYKLAIFDLDGTILDTLDDLADATNHALTVCGYPTRTTDEVRRFVGNGVRLLMTRAVPEGTSAEEIDRSLAEFKAYYGTHCAIKTKPYDGICEMLKRLRAEGCKTAVLSNKADFAVKPLCKQYFDGLLDYAAGEREHLGIPKKPAPEPVWAIADELGIDRADCVYIGDSDVDIDTAKNAGMDCISVDWGLRERELLIAHGAEKIVSTPDALMAAILG